MTRIEIVEADESEPFGIDFVEYEYCYAADGFSPGFSGNQMTESYTWQRIGLRWVSNWVLRVVLHLLEATCFSRENEAIYTEPI